MIDLTGRIALVTGAGSGIGRATALLLGQAGARVALVDVRPDRISNVVSEASERGYEVEGIAADVSREGEINAAVEKTVERWGALDILVANAGISPAVPLVDMEESAWDNVIEVDLDGAFYTVRAAIPPLKQSRHARVICTSSHFGVLGKEGMAHYAASKGGVIGLVRSLALELAPYGITVNAVAPGPVQTAIFYRTPEMIRAWEERIPLGRIGQPEDIAGPILFLASDLSTWVTGHVLQVNGGFFMQ